MCKPRLKGDAPLRYHLGCDFGRDPDGTLFQSARQYVERMNDNYARLFGSAPQQYKTPLEPNDHPELDLSPELDEDGIQKHQSLIGSLQWAASLGRLDITTAVMTMSGFRANPREGHLARARRIVGFLVKFKHASLRYRTGCPDHTDLAPRGFNYCVTLDLTSTDRYQLQLEIS